MYRIPGRGWLQDTKLFGFEAELPPEDFTEPSLQSGSFSASWRIALLLPTAYSLLPIA